jgi:PAS domain S-box-containing protein
MQCSPAPTRATDRVRPVFCGPTAFDSAAPFSAACILERNDFAMPTTSPRPATSPSPSLSASSWKRFQDGANAPVPLLALDKKANIVELTNAARALLGYEPNATLDDCFFTHVHGRNLQVVMRDLAHMMCQRKRQASWLLRMRTRNGRWRWFRAAVQALPESSGPNILVRLRTV